MEIIKEIFKRKKDKALIITGKRGCGKSTLIRSFLFDKKFEEDDFLKNDKQLEERLKNKDLILYVDGFDEEKLKTLEFYFEKGKVNAWIIAETSLPLRKSFCVEYFKL